MKKIILTFDLEEFDLPGEFGKPLEKEKEFEISKKGLLNLTILLDKYQIKATFFTTANFAVKYPELIRSINKKHEIGCHGYSHSDSYSKDLSKISLAKKEIEKIIKKKIKGFRASRFEIKNISGLSEFGFSYDSSIHPTFIPGRYMNLFKKRKVHKIGNIFEVPLSVLPLLRLPIFWLAFKNFGLKYAKTFTRLNPAYIMLVFHPWEFVALNNFKIPFYIKRKSGKKMLDLLEKYITFCMEKKYCFKTIEELLNINLYKL